MLRTLCNSIQKEGRITCIRSYCAAKPNPEPEGLRDRPDPHEIDKDYIGQPDPVSNLRPYVRHIPKDETPLQRRFRLKQIDVEGWNQEFWTRHNKRFIDDKKEFIRLHKLRSDEEVSADKLSVFYKHFLDQNWKLHLWYGVSWYIKNFQLLVLALQVAVQKLYRKI